MLRAASRMLPADHLAEMADADGVASRAVAIYQSICQRADVQELYGSGDVLHEVPFTLRREAVIVRGTIDCLIHGGSRVTVLEFKTGRRRPEHEAQAALYAEAAQALFPGALVQAQVIYAAEAPA